MRTIVIVIEGGVLVEVENLPDDWYYEVDDRDSQDIELSGYGIVTNEI